MSARRWTVADNRERLEGGAKAMTDGLIATCPELGQYEALLTKALCDYGAIVGRHVAGRYEEAPELDSCSEAETLPIQFSTFAPMEAGFAA